MASQYNNTSLGFVSWKLNIKQLVKYKGPFVREKLKWEDD